MEFLPDMGPTIKDNASSQMEAAISALSGELSKLRTGRASSGAFLSHHRLILLLFFSFSFLCMFCGSELLLCNCILFIAGMLDHIIVETGDVKLPLNQIAVVSVMDLKTLSINPFDPTVIN